MIYIDAEQLQDGLYNIKDGKIYKYKAKGGTVRTYKLENRPQGEWIGYEVPSECSVCGHCWDEYVFGQEIWYDGSVPNYCPHCGAKMKGA